MPLPSVDTVVSYPTGAVSSDATVVHTEPLADGLTAVLLDATPCHPIDAGWPDQPADRAVLIVDGNEVPVTDAVVAATDGTRLFVGSDIPVRKGEDGWAFVVAHLVPSAEAPREGRSVGVVVDAPYRAALSAGHTACHLASLALNRAMADRWTKPVRTDALGTADFDAAAIESSLIREYGSTDVFRLNKSLRRKGFTVDGLDEQLAAIETAVNAQLSEWEASGAAVRIERAGERLTERRSWVAELPGGDASIPCGGTHVHSLAELGGVQVSLELGEADGTPTLTMFTETTSVG